MQINFDDAAIIGKRDEQQDYKANLIIPDGYALYVLADGMGGQVGGATASREVCNAFLSYFKVNGVHDEHEYHLRLALKESNARLTDVLRSKPEMNGMGCTVIAMLYQQVTNKYWFISVGDSPLYLQKRGGITRINENHAYYEELLDSVKDGGISQQVADEHPDRHAITSAVMGKEIKLVDYKEGVLKKGDLLLLASDGVQTLSDSVGGELERILATEEDSISVKVKKIISSIELKDDPLQDNTTLILIEPIINEKQKPEQPGFDRTANVKVLLAAILSFILGGAVMYLWNGKVPTNLPILVVPKNAPSLTAVPPVVLPSLVVPKNVLQDSEENKDVLEEPGPSADKNLVEPPPAFSE